VKVFRVGRFAQARKSRPARLFAQNTLLGCRICWTSPGGGSGCFTRGLDIGWGQNEPGFGSIARVHSRRGQKHASKRRGSVDSDANQILRAGKIEQETCIHGASA